MPPPHGPGGPQSGTRLEIFIKHVIVANVRTVPLHLTNGRERAVDPLAPPIAPVGQLNINYLLELGD